jgi:hypothetical protein
MVDVSNHARAAGHGLETVVIHEHVRLHDEAENWPGRYVADAELAAAPEAT